MKFFVSIWYQDRKGRATSNSQHPFEAFDEAMRFCVNGISYSGGSIRSVTLVEDYGGDIQHRIEIFSSKWDYVSKLHGFMDLGYLPPLAIRRAR